MSVRKGFGSIVEKVLNLYVLGNPQPSNRNLIIQLSGKNEKQITDIICGYTLTEGDTTTVLRNGRLLVTSVKLDDATLEINTKTDSLPSGLDRSNILLDVPIYPTNSPIHLNFSKPLYFNEGVDVSVILTYCGTDVAGEPASNPCIASLSVNGFVGGSQKIFKELR